MGQDVKITSDVVESEYSSTSGGHVSCASEREESVEKLDIRVDGESEDEWENGHSSPRVSSLFSLCVQAIIDNIGRFESFSGLPFDPFGIAIMTATPSPWSMKYIRLFFAWEAELRSSYPCIWRRLTCIALRQLILCPRSIPRLAMASDILRCLDLAETKLSPELIQLIKGLSRLEILGLAHTNLTDQHMKILASPFAPPDQTNLLMNENSTGGEATKEVGLASLIFIDIENTDISHQSIDSLSLFPNLSLMYFGRTTLNKQLEVENEGPIHWARLRDKGWDNAYEELFTFINDLPDGIRLWDPSQKPAWHTTIAEAATLYARICFMDPTIGELHQFVVGSNPIYLMPKHLNLCLKFLIRPPSTDKSEREGQTYEVKEESTRHQPLNSGDQWNRGDTIEGVLRSLEPSDTGYSTTDVNRPRSKGALKPKPKARKKLSLFKDVKKQRTL
ncbi:uncharacterized protein VTP21DRAFT_11157 [Calcarisporiella thermophila]|uniref:uncharacterized protein n=1 Tax=Calcarisporiella thermophila TaxID=911321 RepID=UPI00374340E5